MPRRAAGRLSEHLSRSLKLKSQLAGRLLSQVAVAAMHPFASYVLRSYYKETGWNEDNLYANLTRSSNGE